MVILGALAYLPALDAPFILDDHQNILNNPGVRLNRLTWTGLEKAATESRAFRRPLANLSFALNYYFQGYQAAGFRLVNLFLHLVTALLLYALCRTTLGLAAPESERRNQWIAFFAALFWMLHPVQVESVTYIVQRMNGLAAMWYVAAMLLYARGRLAVDSRSRRLLYNRLRPSRAPGPGLQGNRRDPARLPFPVRMVFFSGPGQKLAAAARLPWVAGLLVLLLVFVLIYTDGHPLAGHRRLVRRSGLHPRGKTADPAPRGALLSQSPAGAPSLEAQPGP